KSQPNFVYDSIKNDEEKHEINPAVSGINNSEITGNRSISPKYFIDSGEYAHELYNTPVITMPIAELIEIAQSSRHEIVIDEIFKPETGTEVHFTLKPEEISRAINQLLNRVIVQPDKHLSGHKIISEGEIPENEIFEPVNGAFRIYLKDKPQISTQEQASEDFIAPDDVKKTIEIAKPEYTGGKSVLDANKIAEAILNSSKVKYVSKNNSDFIPVEIKLHEETLPLVGQRAAVVDYFSTEGGFFKKTWMDNMTGDAGNSSFPPEADFSKKAPLNSLPNEIMRDIQKIQVEIVLPEPVNYENNADINTLHITGKENKPAAGIFQSDVPGRIMNDTSIPGINTQEIPQNEFIYAGTIKKQEGIAEETPVHFVKSGITQTDKEYIITLNSSGIELTGEREKTGIIQEDNNEAKNANSGPKAPIPADSRIIIEKEFIMSLTLEHYNESEEIKVPVKIQTESQTQPASIKLPVSTVNEILNMPPADSKNDKTEMIVRNGKKPLKPSDFVEPSKKGDFVFSDKVGFFKKEIFESYSNTQNNKYMPERNETVILRIPVKTCQIGACNSSEAGVNASDELYADTILNEDNIIPENEHSSTQAAKYKSVHMIKNPALETVQYPGKPIDEHVRLPEQISLVIEEQQDKGGMKIQGMFILKDPENTGQSAGAQSTESTGEQLNNENRLQQAQGLENIGSGSGGRKQDAFPEKEANSQAKAQKQIFDINTGKGIAIHRFLEVNAVNEGTPGTEYSLPIWDVDELAEQILRQANVSMKKGSSEMRIQLVPPHLGKMLLRIEVENQKMAALVRVETHEAKQLIQDNVHLLRESMAERGVDIQKFDVFVQQDYQDYMNNSRWIGYNRQFERLDRQNSMPNDNTNAPLITGIYPETSGIRQFGYNTMELIA
ncbi:hypothetical protein AMJ80_01955, partial [bacterium SM23_31]